MPKLLLVEDDAPLAQSIKNALVNERYIVELALTGSDALDLLAVSNYDLVILDWHLPGATGIEICRWMRQKGLPTSVLMLTANASESAKIIGLDVGADDYLTKPFLSGELLARVRALLRRPVSYVQTDRLSHGPYTMFPTKFLLEKQGTKVALQPQEFALLEFFFRHPSEVFSIDTLLMRVWKSDVEASEDSLRGCIKRIRKKLDDTDVITNVHGVGYKLGGS